MHTDLDRLCAELLSTQSQNHIRFFDPEPPWIDNPDISRPINAVSSALYYAARTGLADSVRELLTQGLDVNAVGGIRASSAGSRLQRASGRHRSFT
ncbi:hypothetical protein B0T25DRAFT_548804 [Lasiosphaeria hispida]|uniref:Ankyrin repeat protein n=1 Tax=Lasiosphaeria hispida TaxID=260671 RepID=A0AAJ0HFQ1_9PEZI|nr:hypothetical protein B0T25DRAFT_548804 [Lasiosphaeria hispida]